MIECTKCGEIFDYTSDIDKWARYCSDKWSLEAREICEDCWEELNATSKKE
jgi:Fe2+ or Zn2+ uptake regulation protein